MLATQPASPFRDEPLIIGNTRATGNPLAQAQIGQLLPTARDTPMDEVKRRFERDGYVFMKGLIDPDIILKARQNYFENIKDTGILDPNRPPEDGVFVGGEDAQRVYIAPGTIRDNKVEDDPSEKSIAIQESEWLDKFSTTPQLLEFVKGLMGCDNPLRFKRQMLRAAVPGKDGVLVHYDQLFFREGPPTFLTCWTPLDFAATWQGSLMYLDRSRELGEEMEKEFNKNAAHLTNEERKSAFNINMMPGGAIHPDASGFASLRGRTWLMADFEPGDVAFHDPFVIHASCVNQSNKVIPHTDIRFVDPSAPYDERWTVYWRCQRMMGCKWRTL